MAKKKEKPAEKSVFFGGRWSGISQLTFVEHALSPLNADGPFDRVAEYFYSVGGERKLGTANISASVGYEPEDDFYLWGMLALTLSQPGGEPKLYCSARYILRQLSIGEGGKNVLILRRVLERLASVHYKNDDFYDPVRRMHRRVNFTILSYNLPKRADSIQGWNIYWDQAFFEMVEGIGGFLAFDLETFRTLTPAARRLFLWLSKYFYSGKKQRVTVTAYQDVKHLAVHVLGYADGMEAKDYNRKVKTCVTALGQIGVISPETTAERIGKGKFRIRFLRGPYFDKTPTKKQLSEKDQAIFDTLQRIGLDEGCIRWVLREFPIALINQWADVTFAAMEAGKVRESSQQFFIHHIKKAKSGEVTPPDWYRELERDRIRKSSVAVRKTLEKIGIRPASEDRGDFDRYLEADGRSDYAALVRSLFSDYRKSGADEIEAREEAQRSARKQLEREFRRNNQLGARRLF